MVGGYFVFVPDQLVFWFFSPAGTENCLFPCFLNICAGRYQPTRTTQVIRNKNKVAPYHLITKVANSLTKFILSDCALIPDCNRGSLVTYKKPEKSLWGHLLDASSVGIHLVVSTFAGLAIGYGLDHLFGTSPWLTFIFLIIGI